MNIGTLRHRITIQALTRSSNPFVTDDAWSDLATLWADITPITSKEVFQVGQLNMKVSHRVTIRYPGNSVSISAGNRVLYGNRMFELQQGIENPDERNIQLQLLAYELDPTQ